jgi:AraC-like DNA-binding protein
MLNEPSTIAAAARLIGETLQRQYQIDYLPLFRRVGIAPERLEIAGARYPWSAMQKLWVECVRETGDPGFGLVVGANVRPTTFHALGFAWIASRTLLESLQRLCRYSALISNAPNRLELVEHEHVWLLTRTVAAPGDPAAQRIAADAFSMAILRLCKQASTRHFAPQAVYFQRPPVADPEMYVRAFEAPVYFSQAQAAIAFDRETLERQLPGDNLELAIANDRIAEDYIAALMPDRVATAVRKLLIERLPSGDASQEAIARQLNRSLSTLQRQLAAENITYQQIREQTRADLAVQYVREGRYTLSQIAFLLGFSDQSNFSRAFRRWTGQSPRSYALSMTH